MRCSSQASPDAASAPAGAVGVAGGGHLAGAVPRPSPWPSSPWLCPPPSAGTTEAVTTAIMATADTPVIAGAGTRTGRSASHPKATARAPAAAMTSSPDREGVGERDRLGLVAGQSGRACQQPEGGDAEVERRRAEQPGAGGAPARTPAPPAPTSCAHPTTRKNTPCEVCSLRWSGAKAKWMTAAPSIASAAVRRAMSATERRRTAQEGWPPRPARSVWSPRRSTSSALLPLDTRPAIRGVPDVTRE